MNRDLLILRDPRESWKRCSLKPLRDLPGVRFVAWKPGLGLEGEGRVLLDPAAEPLGEADAGRRLLLLDSSWRRLPLLRGSLVGAFTPRSLPPLRTAYPRKSSTFDDPERGLASIEALYAALALLGRPDPELLEGYRFAEAFLVANPALAEVGSP
jgi:pre-rRNA-processing protein TSR3